MRRNEIKLKGTKSLLDTGCYPLFHFTFYSLELFLAQAKLKIDFGVIENITFLHLWIMDIQAKVAIKTG